MKFHQEILYFLCDEIVNVFLCQIEVFYLLET